MKTRKTIPIGGLPKHDAWSLFKKMAGASIESDLELLPIADQVLDECDGLPVAIATVGGALQGKSISSWRNALRELRNACPENVPGLIKDVYGKIEFSYECLYPSEEAKSCFLLCCLFPESGDLPIETLVTVGIGLEIFKGINSISEGRDRVQELVDTLKCRSLLLDIDDKECVRMHDVVRDVALYIASEESARKKNDQLKRRIVLKQGLELNHLQHMNNGIKESTHCILLTTSMSTTELLLLLNTDSSQLKLPATFFDGMEDLKVLYIWNAILPVLPQLKKLKTLILEEDCRLDFDVDVIGELHTLMMLDLSDSDIYQLPVTFKNLSNLRHLNLTGCQKLQVISPGVISSLSRLEELYMWSSFRHWVVEKLGSTETTNWISQFKFDDEPEDDAGSNSEILDDVDMGKKLNRMAIEQRASTEKTTDPIKESSDQSEDETSETEEFGDVASEFFDSYMSAQKYNQITSWAKSMDWNVGLLAELLSLGTLTTLEVVLPPVENLLTSKLFHMLERFKISIGWGNHEDLEDLEEGNLRVHDLDASSLAGTGISLLLKKTNTLELKMKNLADPLNVLDVNCRAKLESLKLKECKSLEYLIDRTLGESSPRSVFPVLKDLEIKYGDKLKEIFHGDLPSGSLLKLEELRLSFLPALTTICSVESQFVSVVELAFIEIHDCQSLEAIFGLEGSAHHVKEINLLNLTRLYLTILPSFTGISKSSRKGVHKQLEVSNLHPNSLAVEHSLFSDPKVVFPVLRELRIDYLSNLEKIWNGQHSSNSFCELRQLHVENCDKLLHLVPTQMQNRMQTVEFICVRNCSSLEEIFEVRRLTVHEDQMVSNISQSDQGMEKQACRGFQNLTKLQVSLCGYLRYLLSPSIARGLVKLKELGIKNCQKMEAIIVADEDEETENNVGMFPQLYYLQLEDLPSFTGISKSSRKGVDKQLEVSSVHPNSLVVEHSLFSDPKVVFPVLRELRIDYLGNLEKIWNGQHSSNSFCELRQLHLDTCDKLLHLVPTQMQNRLQTLESIEVRNCSSLEEIFEVRRLTVHEDQMVSNISQSDQGMEKQACRGFQNLTKLKVGWCGNLRYLHSPSIARGLVKLKELGIKNCPKMEAIVVADEDEETENNVCMFPQLYYLQLEDLPNLGSFSEGKYTFDWPLKRIIIKNCNKMMKFCLGSLSISREVNIYVSDSGENLKQELMESRKES